MEKLPLLLQLLQALMFVGKLPKTRSGKIIRRAIKALFEGKDLGDLSTIEDGTSIDEVRKAIEELEEKKV